MFPACLARQPPIPNPPSRGAGLRPGPAGEGYAAQGVSRSCPHPTSTRTTRMTTCPAPTPMSCAAAGSFRTSRSGNTMAGRRSAYASSGAAPPSARSWRPPRVCSYPDPRRGSVTSNSVFARPRNRPVVRLAPAWHAPWWRLPGRRRTGPGAGWARAEGRKRSKSPGEPSRARQYGQCPRRCGPTDVRAAARVPGAPRRWTGSCTDNPVADGCPSTSEGRRDARDQGRVHGPLPLVQA